MVKAMAEINHQEEEPTLYPKRKPDLSREDNPHKAQKLEPPPPDTNNDSSLPLHKNHHLEPSPLDSSIPQQNDAKFESNLLAEVEDDDDDDDDDDEEEEEYEDEDEDDDEDSENGDEKAVVDRKGKGIMRADKGKGKLIEEENDDDEDDDDSDSDIGSDVSDGESDLSDDPLAEVDLDNILPSRTRRRTVQPGIHIANDHHNHNKNHDDGDSGA